MNELKKTMVDRALERYNSILPCSNRNDFSECFTEEGNRLLFWFNTEDQNTHLITAEIA